MARWSKTLIPTLKEVPQDAEIPSHRLMLRAGLIRRLGSGLYTFLPLGLKVLQQVSAVVRNEMNKAGAQEVLMPALQPSDLWEKTGRMESLKEVMFNFEDRAGRTMVLGPTHEEVITDLISREISSYKQLPVNLYQIQTKFRDEIRPRFGLMRGREFIMKDAYSFDTDWDAADISYRSMYDAYHRIFERCGLRVKAVEADTGAMGGNDSHEFMVLAETGEDTILESENSDYAANLEKATGISTFDKVFDGAENEIKTIETPNAKSIEEVSSFLNVPAHQLIKTLIYSNGEKEVAFIVAGNRDINEFKIPGILNGGPWVLASDETVQKVAGCETGFIGPVGLDIAVIADYSLEGIKGAITGANEKDKHMIHVDLERDAKVKRYEDISIALEGDTAPDESGPLKAIRGIEVGHVFKLGTKYSKDLGAEFLNQHGKQELCVMGCYGIGVTRTLASIIEQRHDDNGIIWPATICPFEIQILPLNVKSAEVMTVAEDFESKLLAAGIDVLFDDRDERPGFKFKDADLLGVPLRVAIGDRSLEKGVVEIKRRDQAEVAEVKIEDALSTLQTMLSEMKASPLLT